MWVHLMAGFGQAPQHAGPAQECLLVNGRLVMLYVGPQSAVYSKLCWQEASTATSRRPTLLSNCVCRFTMLNTSKIIEGDN